MTGTWSLDPRGIRDLAPLVLDNTRRLKVMPASFYEQTTREERAVFGVRNAIYGLPTLELVQWLKAAIGERSAIEIGAGTGVLAQALGITATDSLMQQRPDIRAYYQALRQPVIAYGSNVVGCDASAAVARFKPQVVLASWVTHRFDPARAAAEGNADGVVEEDIIRDCETYIVIGNSQVHRGKSIWALPHVRFEPPWLYSRAFNGTADFLAVWGNAQGLPAI